MLTTTDNLNYCPDCGKMVLATTLHKYDDLQQAYHGECWDKHDKQPESLMAQSARTGQSFGEIEQERTGVSIGVLIGRRDAYTMAQHIQNNPDVREGAKVGEILLMLAHLAYPRGSSRHHGMVGDKTLQAVFESQDQGSAEVIHQFHMHGEENGQTRFQAKCGEWFDNALMMTPDGLSLEQALNQGSPLCRSCLSESRRPAGIARLSTRGGHLVDDIGKAWQDRG